MLIFVSCKSTPPQNGGCAKLESDLKTDWQIGTSYPTVTDTLVYKLNHQYKDCFKGKDSSSIFKLLGKKYNLELPEGRKLCANKDGLKFSIEYIMRTPRHPYDHSDGYMLELLIDSSAIVRCVNVLKVENRPIE